MRLNSNVRLLCVTLKTYLIKHPQYLQLKDFLCLLMRHRKRNFSLNTKISKYVFQQHTEEEANQRTNLRIVF